MKQATTERVRDQAARAEAWKRYALRIRDDRDALGYQLAAEPMEPFDLGPCPRCEEYRQQLNEEIREGQRAARDAYAEGQLDARYERDGW